MRQVAGDRDMVGMFRLQIGPERVEHIGPVLMAPPEPPRNVAQHPLAEQLARPHAVERRQMQVRQMREREFGIQGRRVALVRVDFQLYGGHLVSI